MADKARNKAELEEKIRRSHRELRRTVAAIPERVSPGNVAQRQVARFKGEAAQLTRAVGGSLSPVKAEDIDPDELAAEQRRVAAVAAVGLVAVGVTAVVLWRLRRRSRRR